MIESISNKTPYICVGLLIQFRGVPRGWGASYEKKQRGCPTLLKKFKLYAEKFCLYNTVANTSQKIKNY